eukprot:3356178-Rhodomonas_salina.1
MLGGRPTTGSSSALPQGARGRKQGIQLCTFSWRDALIAMEAGQYDPAAREQDGRARYHQTNHATKCRQHSESTPKRCR